MFLAAGPAGVLEPPSRCVDMIEKDEYFGVHREFWEVY